MTRALGRSLAVIAAILLTLWAVAAGHYYHYAAHGSTPYDEIGIGLSPFMPAPIRAWGCGQLRETWAAVSLEPSCRPGDYK